MIGGGLPVGAYGGRRDIMELVAPAGPVYQAGTLSGNPLAMTAGIETLRALAEPGLWDELERVAGRLEAGLRSLDGVQVARGGLDVGLFFAEVPVTRWDTARTRTWTASPLSTGGCSTAASIWLRRSSRPGSYRRPTGIPRST